MPLSLFVPPRFRFFALTTLLLVLSGCAGGDSYSVDTADLAQRYLPTTQTVEHHPDSLQSFSITEGEERFEVSLENSYGGLHRKWSCTYQNLGTGASRRTRSYATFWSKELSLASLEAEVGFSTISKERARELLQERTDEYQRVLQIEIYWFESEGNSLLAGPGSRVELEVDGERYRPTDESHGPLRETFLLQGDGRALYRRNTFYFARTVNDTDLLENTEGVTLTVNRSGRRVRFSWEWQEQSKAHLHRETRSGHEESPVFGPHTASDALFALSPTSTDRLFLEHGR